MESFKVNFNHSKNTTYLEFRVLPVLPFHSNDVCRQWGWHATRHICFFFNYSSSMPSLEADPFPQWQPNDWVSPFEASAKFSKRELREPTSGGQGPKGASQLILLFVCVVATLPSEYQQKVTSTAHHFPSPPCGIMFNAGSGRFARGFTLKSFSEAFDLKRPEPGSKGLLEFRVICSMISQM